MYGSLGGAKGMFPSAFIDTVPDNLPMKSDKTEDSTDTSTETTAVRVHYIHTYMYSIQWI